MTDGLLTAIYGAGVAQGLFLALALITIPSRGGALKLLIAALVFAFTVMLGEELAEVLGAPLNLGLGLSIEFAVGPLFYLFARSLSDASFRLTRRAALHFAPFGAASVLLAILNAVIGEGGVSVSNPTAAPFVTAWAAVKAVYFAVYAWAAFRVLAAPTEGTPPRRRAAARWVRVWFILTCALVAAIYVNFALFVIRPDFAPDSDRLSGFLLAVAVYALGYFALARRNVVFAPGRAEAPLNEEATAIAERARAALARDELYRDGDLTVAGLARAVGESEAGLSRALGAAHPGGFAALVNDLRLDAFLRAVHAPEARDRTVLELAFDAGFNSKATFYRAFRAREGVTPTVYRANLDRGVEEGAAPKT